MSRIHRLLALLAIVPPACLVLLSAAAPCLARTVPDPNYSTCDVLLVGNSSGTAMSTTPPGFDVRMADIDNRPLPGVVVTVDFSASGMRLYAAQNPGTTLDCAARTVSRTTDAQGFANFALRVGGYTNAKLVHVTAAGGLFDAYVPARSTDIDGADGRTGLADFAYFAARFNLVAAPECNFDASPTDVPGLGDLALFAGEYMSTPPAAYCP